MTKRPRVLGIVLAGGEGKRLMPLTLDRSKPAVPFGGGHRMIDFVLSNMVNGGIHRIAVLTQYKSHSLDRHISTAWRLASLLGGYVTPVPAQQRRGPHWYLGSADAIYQSMNLIHDEAPDIVAVFGADNVYRMDPAQMEGFLTYYFEYHFLYINGLEHVESGAGVTVAGIRVPRDQASAFGVIHTEDGTTISEFLEKPADPPGLPDSPDESFVSMGNYVFSTDALKDALAQDAADSTSRHDMGGDIVPQLVARGEAGVYDFNANVVPGETERDHGYWRPPAKFIAGGVAQDSMVSAGCIVSGAQVVNSVLSPGVFLEQGAVVQDSILCDRVRVGAGAVVRRAILDKNVEVPAGAHIGVDLGRDRSHYHVSDNGIVVLGKGALAVR